jgi:hypothetical protein
MQNKNVMKHKTELLLGIMVILAGVIVLAYWGNFVVGGFGYRDTHIDYVSIFGILLIFGGFAILYYFVFRKWELEHGSGVIGS